MPRYFIGNVLSPTETQPEQHDPTFAFTRREAYNLDLTGKPIRMEHHPDLEVGTIMRNWQAEDGSVWITGKLNDDTLESKFSQYAIEKNPETGASYYTGLSLQHTHTQFANVSNSKKEGVEVSLCVQPRRQDCRIAFVDSEPNQDKTKKIVYKMHQASFKTNMSETQINTTENTTTEAAPETAVESTPNVETPVTTPSVPSEQTTEMSREDMMKVIIDQQKQLEDQTTVKSAEANELAQLKKMLEEQKANELKKDEEKAYALSKALVDQWAETMNEAEFDPQSKEAVMQMAKNYPRESMALMRVAHCASGKYNTLNSQFSEYKEVMKRSQLQEKFQDVMSRKRKDAPVAPVVHAASTKRVKVAPKQNNVQSFLKAMSKYNSSGSARDHMDAVSQIGTRRNAPRAPYY
jgi:hypothetical protein